MLMHQHDSNIIGTIDAFPTHRKERTGSQEEEAHNFWQIEDHPTKSLKDNSNN